MDKQTENKYEGKINNITPIEITISKVNILMKETIDNNQKEDTVIHYQNLVTFAINAQDCFLLLSYSESNEKNQSITLKIHFNNPAQCINDLNYNE